MSILTNIAMTALTGFGILLGTIVSILLLFCVFSFFSSEGKPSDWDKIVGGVTCVVLLCLFIGYGVRS